MTRFCGFALLMLSSAAWGAEAPAFHFKAPVPGSKVTTTSSDVTEFAFHGPPLEGRAIKTRTSKVYELEILEANDKAETKVRVHYLVAEDTTESQGQVNRKVSPIAGKTYVITSAASGLKILGEGGGAPAKEELDLVKKELGFVGKPDQICLDLDGKRLKAGEGVDPNLLASMLGSIVESATVDSSLLQLREIHTRSDGILAGLFDFKTKVKSSPEGGPQITISSTGSLEIALDPCRMLTTEVGGPMSAAGVVESNGQKISIHGEGTAQINIQAQYK